MLWIAGPPWAMTLVVRFDDHAEAPSGERIYENRTAIVARTRWGRIVEQWDFYEDTGRILELERRLSELEVLPTR
jgi:ketosteroid isomerase-like protein